MTCPPFPVRLDRRFCLNGIHSGGNTTWTTPVNHGGTTSTIRVVTQAGVVLTPSSASGATVVCAGNHSSAPATVGLIFEMNVLLSRPFRRDQGGTPFLADRLTISDIVVSHKDTGDYDVATSYDEAVTKTRQFNHATAGAVDARGFFRAQHTGDAETMHMRIISAYARPVTITGVEMLGEAAPGMVKT